MLSSFCKKKNFIFLIYLLTLVYEYGKIVFVREMIKVKIKSYTKGEKSLSIWDVLKKNTYK